MNGLTPLFLESRNSGLELSRRSRGEGGSAELKRT